MNPVKNNAIIHLTSTTALDTVVGRIAGGTAAGSSLGRFFMLIKINDIEALAPWAEPYIAFVEDTYYQTEIDEASISIERALTITKQRAKRKLQLLISEARTINFQSVSYCFGAISGHNLSLTHVGDIKAYLLHCGKGGPEENLKCRWIDITSTPIENKRAKKINHDITNSVVSGEIQSYDTLIVCTESITDTLGFVKLQQIVATSPINVIESTLKRFLKDTVGRGSCGAIIVRPDSAPKEMVQTETVTSSMTSLKSKENATAGLLDPENEGIFKQFWRLAKKTTPKTAKQIVVTKDEPIKSLTSKKVSISYQKIGWHTGQLIRKIINALTRIVFIVVKMPLTLLVSSFDEGKRFQIQKNFRTQKEEIILRIVEWLKKLPRSSQRLLIVSLLFGFLFIQTLVYLADRQIREETVQQNNKIIAAIQDRIDQAESSIVFGNDADTVKLITEAESLLSQFPTKTKSQREQYDGLKQTIDEIVMQLEKLTIADKPDLVTALANSNFTGTSGIVFINNELVAYRSANNTFASINPTNGILSVKQITSANIGNIKNGKIDDRNRIIFFANNSTLATLNLETNTLESETIENAPTDTVDFSLYNSRLYILKPKDKQIYRFRRASNGYNQSTPWINGNIPDVENSSAIAVDGNIYVLSKDSTLKKFFSGNEIENWTAVKPLNVGNNATKLLTIDSSKYIYALEKDSNRIIIWRKENGRLEHQFSFPNLGIIDDFTVDPKDQYIYILSGDSIYKSLLLK